MPTITGDATIAPPVIEPAPLATDTATLLELPGGATPRVTDLLPNQPANGFRDAATAVQWLQHQTWWDPDFRPDQPNAAVVALRESAEAAADRPGVTLHRLDSSLRRSLSGVATSGAPISWNESVPTYHPRSSAVAAVLDGHAMLVSPGRADEVRAATLAGDDVPAVVRDLPLVELDGTHLPGAAATEAASGVGQLLARHTAGLLIGAGVLAASAAAGATILADRSRSGDGKAA